MDESPKPITVFLLDDHEIVRRGVRELIEAEPGLSVVGEASTAAEAMQRIAAESSAVSGTTNLGALLRAKLDSQKDQ